MVGSSGDVNQGTTVGDDERACRGQSVRSSEEASNDRGAKGRRKAVLGAELRPSREGRRSAVRLCASVRRKTAWLRKDCWQWAAHNRVSGSARTARLVCSLRASRNTYLSQPIGGCRLESRMQEICLSGLGGRGSALRSSYPHHTPRKAHIRYRTVRSLLPLYLGQSGGAMHCPRQLRGQSSCQGPFRSPLPSAHTAQTRPTPPAPLAHPLFRRHCKPGASGMQGRRWRVAKVLLWCSLRILFVFSSYSLRILFVFSSYSLRILLVFSAYSYPVCAPARRRR